MVPRVVILAALACVAAAGVQVNRQVGRQPQQQGQYVPSCVQAQQPAQEPLIRDYEVAAKDQHNYYRSRHQVPALELERSLNAMAQKCAEYYAVKGMIDSSCPFKNNTGENQYATFYTESDASKPSCLALANSATTFWYNGIQHYDFRQVTYSPKAGGFTQLVWRETKNLGVGCAYYKGLAVFTALYSPPGNLLSYGSDPYVFFRANVLPAVKKSFVTKMQMAQSSFAYSKY